MSMVFSSQIVHVEMNRIEENPWIFNEMSPNLASNPVQCPKVFLMMTHKEFAKTLEKRTRQFAVSVIRLSTRLPKTPEARVIKSQFTDAGMSVGANYREANRSRSRADFRNKMKICEGECSETQYWLEGIVEAEMPR